MPLGERVRDRMTALGLSQAELARRVGVSQPSIYALIHRNKTGSKNLHLIARELGTTPAYLTGETDDPTEYAPPPPQLDFRESQLLNAYRGLTEEQRNAIFTIISGLTAAATQPARRRR